VNLPDPMRIRALGNMRDHLHMLQAINDALSRNAFDEAASLAERRLGMTSLDAHGAADLAPHLPKGMQEIGTQMHRAASRFAIIAQNASAAAGARRARRGDAAMRSLPRRLPVPVTERPRLVARRFSGS
jgi:hypothetical protein